MVGEQDDDRRPLGVGQDRVDRREDALVQVRQLRPVSVEVLGGILAAFRRRVRKERVGEGNGDGGAIRAEDDRLVRRRHVSEDEDRRSVAGRGNVTEHVEIEEDPVS